MAHKVTDSDGNQHAFHYKSAKHEFEASKFGVWIFLCTEILMFGGLFVGYIAYSGLYPDVFEAGSQFLDWKLGALNTIVLLFSSFTIALSIRNLQMNEQKKAFNNLLITFVCGLAFMGIKSVEYNHKFHMGLYPGKYFNYQPYGHHESTELHSKVAEDNKESTTSSKEESKESKGESKKAEQKDNKKIANDKAAEESKKKYASEKKEDSHATSEESKQKAHVSDQSALPANIPMYFSFYFVMTGIHGSHVLIGMGLILWCMIRLKRGDFGPNHYTFVEGAALFWHLVDLVWIYLFPLLYLV